MRLVVLLFALLATTSAFAVSPDDVIKWTKDGLSEAEIIARVRKGSASALSAHEVLRLKDAGVSDNVLKALIGADEPEPAPEPAAPTEKPTAPDPAPQIIRTVDDIIDAHRAGVPTAEIEMRVRGLNLKVLRADRERMKAAGIPDSVIDAASRRVPPLASKRTPSREPGKKQFGDSGTVLLEFAGGVQSVSFGDETFTTVMLAPSIHVLAGVLALGVEGAFASSFGAAGHASFFGVAGVAIPLGESRSALIRAGARVGYGAPDSGDGSVAYGFSVSGMGRSGRLLVGAGVTATWMGDPTVSVFALDLRIGTWF